VQPIAEALARLGAESAMVVHGSDGLDEITVTGPTHYAYLVAGEITEGLVTPGVAGVGRHDASAIRGGEAPENAAAVSRLLAGEAGGYRDIVLINAAAALIVAGSVDGWAAGAAMAADAIDRGTAAALLDHWRRFR
jgi:anthranilate phosphoribosyltransferase